MKQSSFPFFQIANQFDLPYEVVMQAAEKLRKACAVSPQFTTMPSAYTSPLDAIENAVVAENERRALIECF